MQYQAFLLLVVATILSLAPTPEAKLKHAYCSVALENVAKYFTDPAFSGTLQEVTPYDSYLFDIAKCMSTDGIFVEDTKSDIEQIVLDPPKVATLNRFPTSNPPRKTSLKKIDLQVALYDAAKRHCSVSKRISALFSYFSLAQHACKDLKEVQSKDKLGTVTNVLSGVSTIGAGAFGLYAAVVVGGSVVASALSAGVTIVAGAAPFIMVGKEIYEAKKNYGKAKQLAYVMDAVQKGQETVSYMSFGCDRLIVDSIFQGQQIAGDCNRFKKERMKLVCAAYYNNGLPPLYFDDCFHESFAINLKFHQLIPLPQKMADYIKCKARTTPVETLMKLMNMSSTKDKPSIKITNIIDDVVEYDVKKDPDCMQTLADQSCRKLVTVFSYTPVKLEDRFIHFCDGKVTFDNTTSGVKKGDRFSVIIKDPDYCPTFPFMNVLTVDKKLKDMKLKNFKANVASFVKNPYQNIPTSMFPRFFHESKVQEYLKGQFIRENKKREAFHKCCEEWGKDQVMACFDETIRKAFEELELIDYLDDYDDFDSDSDLETVY